MTAVHGSLAAFDSNTEEWTEYIERLEFYFAANGITDGTKQRAVLLSCCGPSTFRLMRSIVLPTPLTDFSFKELVAKMKAHREPKPSVIVQRYQFNSRQRATSETVAEYVAALRKLAEHCNFGNALDEMLRDRLVCGIANPTVQKRLLAEPELTLTKAVTIAQAVELAERGSKEIQSVKDPPKDIHRFSQVPTSKNSSGRPRDIVKDKSSPAFCYRCGGKHNQLTCRFKSEVCHYCHKRGHIAKVCKTKLAQSAPSNKAPVTVDSSKPTHQVIQESCDTISSEYTLFTLPSQQSKPLLADVEIEGHPLNMEIDTGAAVSIISDKTRTSLPHLHKLPLQSSQVKLRTYTGESIPVLGEISVDITCQGTKHTLPLLVVKEDGPSLIGRNWLTQIRLDWKTVFTISGEQELDKLLRQHSCIFEDKLGSVKDLKVKLFVKENSTPKFFKARTLPLSLREKVSEELDKLQANGIIVPVKFSSWAAPVVPVIKRDGNVRLCGDYKLTINSVAKNEVYPLPRIEELFAAVSGGKVFSKLDLSHAYLQLQLDESSQEYVTINTHRGLYRYTRLPFGVASAPAIFQRTMETVLKGLPMVVAYLDDILVAGRTEQEHLTNLAQVLERLNSAGMKLKKEKCAFCLPQVEYLGHVISEEGLRPSSSKIKAITNAPEPSSLSELKSFLGLVNYYAKFLPNSATTLAPLYKLLKHSEPWQWNTEQQVSFENIKTMLTAPTLLVHFDEKAPIMLSCDASPYGVGAVLSHVMEDQSDKPIAYASRSLSTAERKYSQLDKEALAILFGVSKFHHYLYGRHFVIYSDHKPLMHIFNQSKAIPVMASARLQRWALTLSGYQYSIKYRKGSHMCNADALSRLPLPDCPTTVPMPPETIALLEQLASVPLTATQIRNMTDRDPVLTKVKQYTQNGWPNNIKDEQLRPYSSKRDELSLEDGILLWGNRVVVPPQARNTVLEEAHAAHIGIARMKSLTRQFVWWPKIDNDLESKVRSCNICQKFKNEPPQAILHPWEWPKQPWVRIHADFAGPFLGKMFLILIDAHSKWIEVHITASATSSVTIEKMRSTFASFGIPEILVTDNGSNFTSSEFEEFLKSNGIRHVKTAPYHPASNGLAERAVQTFKSGIKKLTNGTLETRVARFLFNYRITPQTTTGVSPSELLLGRRLRCHLDFLRPNLEAKVRQTQCRQKELHDFHARDRELAEGDSVLVKNFSAGNPWLPGMIHSKTGPSSFTVDLTDGRRVRRHLDQLRKNTSAVVDEPTTETVDDFPISVPNPIVELPPRDISPSTREDLELRRSNRTRRPPQRFQVDIN